MYQKLFKIRTIAFALVTFFFASFLQSALVQATPMKFFSHLFPKKNETEEFSSLHEAVFHEDYEAVKQILEKKVNINKKDSEGNTPLYYAVFKKSSSIILLLLENGADINIRNKSGSTALSLAHRLSQKHPNIYHLFTNEAVLEKNQAAKEKSPTDKNSNSFLQNKQNHFSKKLPWQGELYTIEELLEAVTNSKYIKKGLGKALHEATLKNNYYAIEELLRRGAENINEQDHSGNTPLHYAIYKGYSKILLLLMEEGANLDIKNKMGKLPADLTESGSEIWALITNKHLLEKNKLAREQINSLHEKTWSGDLNAVEEILKTGIKIINKQDQHSYTPLHYAVFINNFEMVSLLTDHGADPNAKTNKGLTPLHFAIHGGDIKTISLLIKTGANVDETDAKGDTPLHHAIYTENTKSIWLIIEKGADLDIVNDQQLSPMALAYKTSPEIAALFSYPKLLEKNKRARKQRILSCERVFSTT